MTKKILFLTPVSYFKGGAERSLFDLLSNPNITPILVSPAEGEITEKARSLNIETYILPFGNIHNIHRPFSFLKGLYATIDLYKTAYKLKEISKKTNATIAHSNGLKAHAINCLSRYLGGAKAIIHIRDIPYTRSEILTWKILKTLCDKMILVSHACWPNKTLPSKAIVIHNGTPLIDIKNNIPEKENSNNINIGFIGRIHPAKGLHLLIDWLSEARKQNLPVTLSVRGTYSEDAPNYENAITSQIKNLNLEPNIEFTGFINNDTQLYQDLDIVVVPSDTPDPLPRSIMESMARNILVCGYPAGGVFEMVEDKKTGFLVNDAESFINAVNIFQNNPESIQKITKAAKEKIEKDFTIKKLHFTINNIYKNLQSSNNSKKLSDAEKKILFLTHVGSPGGAEYKMIELCESSEYSSKVVHFQNGLLENILKEKNIPSSILPMPEAMKSFTKDDGLMGAIKAIPATVSMISGLVKEEKKHDVLICFSQKSFILASLAKPFTRKPIIWFMNDILSQEYFSKPVIFIIKTISKLSANHIVLNSQESFRSWESSGASTKNVSVIYPGVDIQLFDQKIQDKGEIKSYRNKFSSNGSPLIGIFGRITPWKGQDVFLQAIAQTPDVNAIIVGDALFGENDYKDSLIALAQSLNIEHRVTFTGHLDNIPAVMASCDIIAHCSTLAEPFGLVIAEATTTNVPTIATDAGGAREIIQHNKTGQLTPMGDVDALVTAIQKYLSQPEWAKELAVKAREHTENNFSNKVMMEKIYYLIRNIK